MRGVRPGKDLRGNRKILSGGSIAAVWRFEGGLDVMQGDTGSRGDFTVNTDFRRSTDEQQIEPDAVQPVLPSATFSQD